MTEVCLDFLKHAKFVVSAAVLIMENSCFLVCDTDSKDVWAV